MYFMTFCISYHSNHHHTIGFNHKKISFPNVDIEMHNNKFISKTLTVLDFPFNYKNAMKLVNATVLFCREKISMLFYYLNSRERYIAFNIQI